MGQFLMTMKLKTQGKLTASSTTDTGSEITVVPTSIAGHLYLASYDANHGSYSGKRQHKPITIRKEVDAASPLYLNAACNNETIKAVTISFSKPGQNGNGTSSQRITLIDVEVLEVLHFGLFEEVTIAFDDWLVNGIPGGTLEFLLGTK
jgi:type VI secretion system Hcp family effector